MVAAHADAHVTLYSENLDLSRFSGQAFEESLKSHLKEKYQGKSIGAIVSVGAATTEMALNWHDELWPGIPLVFAMLDEMDVARIKPPVDVTGVVVHLPLADAIKVARAVVPDLDTVALVGDAWDGLVVYRNWGGEIGSAAAGLKVIEIIGQKLSDIRERVAGLPERSAIIYSAVFSDGEGKFYLPSVALRHIAEKANRPIVVPAETFLANGGIGGYVLIPSAIGMETAKLALKVLDGARAADIPPVYGGVKPLFNWEQMQRWNVSEFQNSPKAARSVSASRPSWRSIAGRAWRSPRRC